MNRQIWLIEHKVDGEWLPIAWTARPTEDHIKPSLGEAQRNDPEGEFRIAAYARVNP